MSVDQEEEFWIKKRVGSRRTYGSRRGLDSEEVMDQVGFLMKFFYLKGEQSLRMIK